jgi:NADH dehydrogenase
MPYRTMPVFQRPLTVSILGGTGFVGQELTVRLARAGHAVRVLTRDPSHGDDLNTLSSVELLAGNVYNPDFLRARIDGSDVVVNLVGILNERGFGGAGFRRAHVELTAALLRAIAQAHVPRLLHMSALQADAERGRSHYLRTKGEAERLVRQAGDRLDWTIFRPSVIFGPRDSLTNRFAALLRLSAGVLPLARPGARFAPIYVGEVATAFLRSLYGGATSRASYDLCGPEIMTLEQLVRAVARAARLPCHVLRLPDAVARLQALVMQLLPGKPFSTDNFRSLLIDSVCERDGAGQLGLATARLSELAPTWLSPAWWSPRPDRTRGVRPDRSASF